MSPLTVVAIISLFALLYFIWVGINRYPSITNQHQFFLASKSMSSSQFSGSFAASSTSLATVLIFFVTFGGALGLSVLFAPLTYLFGVCFFIALMDRLRVSETVDDGTSLLSFLTSLTGRQFSAFLACVVPAAGSISILLIELYVGVSIFSIFAEPGTINLQLSLAFLSCIIVIYTALGGFPAVIQTDRIQFTLMVIAVAAAVGYAAYRGFIVPDTPETLAVSVDWFPNPVIGSGFFFFPYAIAINILVINTFLQFTQLRTWQMLASSNDLAAAKSGLFKGAFWSAALWTLFAIFGILAAPILGLDTSSIEALMRSMAASSQALIAYVLLPLFFVACLSALISTADSALIPLTQFLCEGLGLKGNGLAWPRLIICILVIVANILYWIVFTLLGFDFLQLLFTIFGLVIVSGPLIIGGALNPRLFQHSAGRNLAIGSVFAGGALVIGFALLATPENVPYGAPAGFAFAALAVAIAWLISE